MPFTLQVRLGDTPALPERLSELEFTVSALYAQPLATFDIPFEPMTAPVELVPGFSVQIESASSEDGKCGFTIKEVFDGFDTWWHGTLDEDSSTCDEDFDRWRPDLPDTDLTYKATMYRCDGQPDLEWRIDFKLRNWSREYKDLEGKLDGVQRDRGRALHYCCQALQGPRAPDANGYPASGNLAQPCNLERKSPPTVIRRALYYKLARAGKPFQIM